MTRLSQRRRKKTAGEEDDEGDLGPELAREDPALVEAVEPEVVGLEAGDPAQRRDEDDQDDGADDQEDPARGRCLPDDVGWWGPGAVPAGARPARRRGASAGAYRGGSAGRGAVAGDAATRRTGSRGGPAVGRDPSGRTGRSRRRRPGRCPRRRGRGAAVVDDPAHRRPRFAAGDLTGGEGVEHGVLDGRGQAVGAPGPVDGAEDLAGRLGVAVVGLEHVGDAAVEGADELLGEGLGHPDEVVGGERAPSGSASSPWR